MRNSVFKILVAHSLKTKFTIKPFRGKIARKFGSSEIDWPDAKRIAEKTCVGLSDAMILNAFQCSHFPFIISADFDIGYAVLASRELKDVVMPDSVAKKYRDYHFNEE